MTRSLSTLVHSVLIALLVLLIPAAAQSQEQNPPGDRTTQENPAEPAQPPKTDDGAATERRSGALLMPATGEKTDAAQEEATAPSEKTKVTRESGGIHIIKQGDTLWDISNTFLKDPFLWPLIWKANPFITNADLIYPGNELMIPALGPIERAIESPVEEEQASVAKTTPERALSLPLFGKRPLRSAPTGTEEEEQAPRNILILPEEMPVPIMDKYAMLNAGFVSEEESSDRIVGSLEEKTIFGYDDIVYVTIKSTEDSVIGDKFIIYHPLERVKHPVTGGNYGRLVKVLGVLQITAKGRGDTFSGRITISFDAATKGSMLTPYVEPTLVYNPAEARAKDITGYILEVMDTRSINAQTDIVYLDKGSEDGVEPGDRFLIYAKPRKKAFPRTVIGEAQVFLVKERTATAVVRKSTDTLSKGDVIESKVRIPEDSSSSTAISSDLSTGTVSESPGLTTETVPESLDSSAGTVSESPSETVTTPKQSTKATHTPNFMPLP